MLQATDINVQSPNIQPTVIVDTSGGTKYTGTSISFGNIAGATWRIKRECTVSTITTVDYPNGDQDFKFMWCCRTGYSYQ